jgi:acetoin utilization deacetylase AcuC-like enzyme
VFLCLTTAGGALAVRCRHHAERDRGMGYCLFSNVALAALHAKAVHGLTRVAIVDYDVHHGNGTQQAFYGDKQVGNHGMGAHLMEDPL